ncbi:MAG: HrpF/NolX family T3SS translocon protein, partial [Pantoea sp.]|nr:HrpF/NolX family T3SS translocon protein [Pantoea sp.]
PAIFAAIDPANNGKSDGKISAKDIQKWQQNPAIRQYADAKAETYTHDYVPSDSAPGSPAREMNANDAMRELYLYSESLPKKVSLETLQKIADGSQDMGKCPPQVAAAAKYYTRHPEQWQQLTGKDDPGASVSRDRLCDVAAYNVKLSPQESKALETLQNNKDIFFKGGGIKPDKLTKIANDTHNSQEVRDAANLLSQPNSMLFSMLDNGKHGAGGNFFNKANDRNIGKGDLDAFIRKGSNQVASPPQLANAPTTLKELSAQDDMARGQETQPDQKKQKGGGIFKLLDILSYVATGLSMLIPGVGAAGVAATAGRAALTAGLKEGLKQGVKQGVQEGAGQAMNAALTAQSGNQQVNAPRVWAQS